MNRTRIVLDVDTGIDDTLALCYLLASPEAELLGVVGVYGNVLASTAVRNNRDVLRLFGRSDVPVYAGAVAPSWADGFAVDAGCARFHGSNGLGDVRVEDYGSAGETVDGASGGAAPTGSDVSAAARGIGSGDGADTSGERRHGGACGTAAVPSSFRHGGVVSIGGPAFDVRSALDTGRPIEWAPVAGNAGCAEGVRFIVDSVRRYGRDVTILATGPLTDVDAALTAAPDIVPLMRLVVMGGALTQQGNCYDLICETNISQDPEAANRVFRSGVDMTMIGLDVTHQCLLTRDDVRRWRGAGGARGRFLADMTRFYIEANEASDPVFLAGSPLHDPLAAAVALDPSLVRCLDINMMVETRTGVGGGFRGRTIGDPTRLRDPRKTGHVALQVDADAFTERFVSRIERLCCRA